MTIDREKLEAHITGLRALHSWMMTNDIDMQCPDEVQDPEDTAEIITALLTELDALRAENARLRAHIETMQSAAANYIEPTAYTVRHPDTGLTGDCAWVREIEMPSPHASSHGRDRIDRRRDLAFISDIIYMLDGPEQREAMSAALQQKDKDDE